MSKGSKGGFAGEKKGKGLCDRGERGWAVITFSRTLFKDVMSSPFPPAALLQRARETASEGGGRKEGDGALLPKVAGRQQQQPTPVGRHRKGEWG